MRKYIEWTVVCTLLIATWAAHAAETDSIDEYALTPKQGPWLIYVTFFRGPDAQEEAHRLAYALRKDHKLPAYTHSVSKKKQEEEAIRQASFRRDNPGSKVPRIRIEDEYAVLVGNYKNMDSARKALEKMKKQDASSWWPSWAPKRKTAKSQTQSAAQHPLARGFAVPNPTVPRDKKTSQ